jgi:hypothetical protein
MTKQRETKTKSAGLTLREPPAEERVNEFDGLSDDAKVELAIARIRQEWSDAAESFLLMGGVVVDACHASSAADALADGADENPLYRRIVTSLGTLRGGPSAKSLSLARRVAAASSVVQGHFWTVVPYSHKALLVELKDAEKMLEGAKRTVEFGWTLAQTQAWVDVERATAGRPKRMRGLRLSGARTACGRLASASEGESLERLADDYGKLPPRDRQKVRAELEKAAAALQRLRRKLDALGE